MYVHSTVVDCSRGRKSKSTRGPNINFKNYLTPVNRLFTLCLPCGLRGTYDYN